MAWSPDVGDIVLVTYKREDWEVKARCKITEKYAHSYGVTPLPGEDERTWPASATIESMEPCAEEGWD